MIERGKLGLVIAMRKTRKDVSGLPKDKLPPYPELDLVLYHWSPTSNRSSINKYGLLTHRLTLQGEWRPPFISFSDDPFLAWIMSGQMWPRINNWDLWMCHDPSQTSYKHLEVITDTYVDTGRHYIKEYRVYTRVYKRDLIYIATRIQPL